MKFLRTLFFIALAAVLLVAIFSGLQGQDQAGAQERAADVLDAATVEVDSLRVTVGATSAVAPIRQINLNFQVADIVTEILVGEGQVVAAGDILARVAGDALEAALRDAILLRDLRQIGLDALLAPPRPQDIAVAQAALDAARAQLNAAYGTGSPQQEEISRLQAELARNALYQAQLQRDIAVNPPEVTITQDVPGVGPVSQTVQPAGADPERFEPNLEQAEFQVQIADARAAAQANRGADAGSVSSAEASVVAAQTTLDRLVNGATDLDIQQAQIELAQAEQGVARAQASLDETSLVAPFAGTVAELNLTVGEPPPSTTALASSGAVVLIDTSAYYLDLPVDESDIARVQVGQSAEISLDALPDVTLTGTVTRLNPAPQPQAAGQQVVTYLVRVTLDPTDAPVRARMTATASIIVDSLNEALVVPSRFIRIDRDSGRTYATVTRADGSFEEVEVQIGVRNETQVQIISGLSAGDEVVLLSRALFNPISQNVGGPPE